MRNNLINGGYFDLSVEDFNPNHDPSNGQFSSGGGSSVGGSKSKSSKLDKKAPSLKSAYREYKRLKEESDKAFEALEKDPENADLDAAEAKAYKEYWDSAETLAKGLVSFTSGKIDMKTARAMLRKKADELDDLFKRWGA